jgi:hypothetical protein
MAVSPAPWRPTQTDDRQKRGASAAIAADSIGNCRIGPGRRRRAVVTLAPVSEVSTSPEVARSSVDQMTFFSDAVVAISMTLLAIDLPVPDSDSPHGLAEFVGEHRQDARGG